MKKPEENLLAIKREGISWKINPQGLPGFKTEDVLSYLGNDNLSEDLLLKKTNTRLIVKSMLGDTGYPLIIKVFKRPHLSDQLKYLVRCSRSHKEWKIGRALSQRNISTPTLVACGVSRRFGILKKDVVITREVTVAEPLIQWVEKNIIQKPLVLRERNEVISALGHFVRRVHDQGIFSKDFHQGNILIHAEKNNPPLLYLIDLHAIQIKKELNLTERIKTLAQFNNFRIPIADRLRFLNAYLKGEEKGEILKKALAQEIGLASFTHWQQLWQKRKERCLRSGKGLETFKTGSWEGVIRKEYNFKNFFPRLDKLGANMKGAGSLVKEVFFQEKAKDLVIRYYNQTSFFSTLRSPFQISPAKKTWITMHNLIMRGIPTLVPVAFGERKRWGILRDCFLAFEKIPEATSGAIFLKELLEEPLIVKNTFLKEKFIFQLAQLIRRIHQTGVCYRTLKSSDIRVTFDHKNVLLHVVNVDGMTIKKSVGINDVVKDLSAIRLSFLQALEQKNQNFFFKIYAWGNTFFKDNEKKIRDKMQKNSAKRGE
ncbi:MAG TPA: lipopolysaccharide kinase InaA family protein [Thermodesulfobacteriota bacterium]|nr:lipopolysaccharide kinase InaA family protein [Thermodesulfobacteriota bacterium]